MDWLGIPPARQERLGAFYPCRNRTTRIINLRKEIVEIEKACDVTADNAYHSDEGTPPGYVRV